MRTTLILSGLALLLAGCDQTPQPGTPPTRSEAAAPSPTSPERDAPAAPPTEPAQAGDAPAPTNSGRVAGRPAPQRPAPAISVPDPSPDSPRLAFDTPAGWLAQEPSSAMRQAQYALPVEDGEPLGLAVFFLGGTVEGNIARWESQFKGTDGQPIADEASTSEPFEANGLKGTLATIRGSYNAPAFMGGGQTEDATMLAAGIEGDERGNWYIRVVGPTDAIEQHADAFRAFLKSARPAE